MPLSATLAATLALTVAPQSICGEDDRFSTFDPTVGVVQSADPQKDSGFCTVTLFSDVCAVTAGHCLSVLDSVVFKNERNNPANPSSEAENRYAVDQSFTRALFTRIGNDWAVIRLKKNELTGLLPGQVQGYVELELDANQPLSGELSLTSMSRDTSGSGFTQLGSTGSILWDSESILYHDLDTSSGASGSLIFDAKSKKGIAIHTHGGCDTMYNNKATIIARVPNLVRAIHACRAK